MTLTVSVLSGTLDREVVIVFTTQDDTAEGQLLNSHLATRVIIQLCDVNGLSLSLIKQLLQTTVLLHSC